jgi:cytidyltransferase-like protein
MKIVIISGYFNPIHSGHVDYIQSAKKLGDKLIVIVNNDKQVILKGSVPFQDEEERKKIVSNIKGVDHAVISIDKDATVCESIRQEYYNYYNDYFFDSMIFCNGGDRKEGGVPEDILEEQFGIQMVYNVGGEKTQSSSSLIEAAKKNEN